MLIESWIAVMIVIFVFIITFISTCGWIIEGERLEKSEKLNKKLIAENGRLYKIISHMSAIHNIDEFDVLYRKEDKKNV